MSSMTVKMNAILLVWVGLFLLGANGIDITREEYLKYKKYLKSVNKPALKSIKTEYGDIFDCVDIYKQLAFDHPLLKNHTLLMRPASLPNWTNEKSLSDQGTSVIPKIGEILGEGCPEGTVPIRRTRMQDLLRAPSLYLHGKKYEGNGTYAGNYMLPNNTQPGHHYAMIQATQGTYYGTKVTMDLWTPQVSSDRMFSLAQYWIIGGPVESFNSIESGWMVNSMLFGDQITRLFTYWTGDGFRGKTGCYNTLCKGYVQTNSLIPLGFIFPHTSTYDGDQWTATLQTMQDANGNWWLHYNDYAMGYFPRDLFPGLGSGPATSVGWGGEAYSPTNVCPPMGSGHFPDEGVRKAGFMRGIKVMNQNRQPEDAPLNTNTIVDIPQNYRVVDPKVISPEADGRSFFYGGPGGNC